MAIKRDRTRDDVHTVACYESDVFSSHNFHEFVTTGTYHEELHDYIDSYSERKKIPARYRPHPVVHLEVRQFLPKNWFNMTDGPYLIDNHEYVPSFQPLNIGLLLPETSPTVLQDMGIKAFNTLYTQIPPSFSLANDLWELPELKGLIPKFEKNLKSTVSGNFLAFQFGWVPLVSDIKALLVLSDSVTKRLKHLKDTRGQETRISFFGKYDPIGPDFVDSISLFSYYRLRYKRTGAQGVFRASGYLTQDLKDLDDTYAQVKAFSAALGLNNPSKIFWNALKYSFVIDWFTNISGLLDRLAIQPFSGEWTIRGLVHSLDESLNFSVYQDSILNSHTFDVLLGTGTIKRYSRGTGLPAPSVMLTNLELGTQKQLLSLALIHQRM